MNTFKHAMGFVLLATVAYLMSFMPIPYVVPMVAFMIGLGAACWWVGRVAFTATRQQKSIAWVQAIVLSIVAGYVSFGWLHGVMEYRFDNAIAMAAAKRAGGQLATGSDAASHEDSKQGSDLPWQPYSRDLLEQYSAQGKTIFVDFTADWCAICKVNEAVALRRTETLRYVADHEIVTLKADKTKPSPEIDALLKQLGNKATTIPFYAVFPADTPNRPIVLNGQFTSPKPVVNALKSATL